MAAGKYYVYAGTDLNNDQRLCDAGEACGAYSSLQQLFELEVTAAGVGDLSIEATFVYDTATTPALQEVIPQRGGHGGAVIQLFSLFSCSEVPAGGPTHRPGRFVTCVSLNSNRVLQLELARRGTRVGDQCRSGAADEVAVLEYLVYTPETARGVVVNQPGRDVIRRCSTIRRNDVNFTHDSVQGERLARLQDNRLRLTGIVQRVGDVGVNPRNL